MAKAQRKNAKTSPRTGGPSRTNDAERLAAIRWLAMKIEQVSIEVFVTDRDKLDDVVGALRATVNTLRQLAPERTLLGDCDADCPPPYVLCRDCLCAPMCDPTPPSLESRKRKR